MDKNPIPGDSISKKLHSSRRDQLYKFLLAEGMIRGSVIHATRMIKEMSTNHKLGPLEVLVLGQAYIAAGLLGANLKSPENLTIKIDCKGPIKALTVDGNSYGEVRGYLSKTPIPPIVGIKAPHLRDLFGKGTLKVTKQQSNSSPSSIGIVELQYGSLAKDLSYYFAHSEQIPTAFNLSVAFDDHGKMIGAGGVLLQALPGASTSTLTDAENTLLKLPSIGTVFAAGKDPLNLIKEQFNSHNPTFIGRRRVTFMCHCSSDRFRSHLSALPKSEIKDLIETGPLPIVTTCLYCNTTFQYEKEEIETLL